MKSAEDTNIKILVLDYDHCAFTLLGSHPAMLSIPLLQHIHQEQYAGFYACTHRCLVMMPKIKAAIDHSNAAKKIKPELIAANWPTYKITEHLQLASGLTCFAVSSIEDLPKEKCGAGYDELIKPYELGLKKSNTSKSISLKEYNIHAKNKNAQLLQIAKHAAKNFPYASITLVFIDDKMDYCHDALSATRQTDWPKNISLQVLRHLADSDNAAIVPVNKLQMQDKHGMLWKKPSDKSEEPANTLVKTQHRLGPNGTSFRHVS